MPCTESGEGNIGFAPVNQYTPMTGAVHRGGLEILDQLSPQWHELCSEGPASEPFYRPEWIAAFVRAFAPRRKLSLVSAWSGHNLKAVLPLVEMRSFARGFGVRKLQGAANVFSCRFDLARASGPEGDEAVQVIWKCLRDRLDWDVIRLPDVPAGGAGELLLDAARRDNFLTGQWESNRSPYIPLGGINDAFHLARDAHFRQNLRRRIRKAQAQWPVRLQRYDTADPAALERFYQVERSGWKGRSKTAIACDPAARQFHDEIARAAERCGYFSLYLLEFGDQAVAGHFGLTCQARYYTLKVGYDEKFAVYGPGHQLVALVLQDCLRRGVREFDFLGPWMEWKGEWARDIRRHSDCYVFRPGLLGQALYLAKFKLHAAIRSVARRPAIAAIRRRVQK